MSNELIFVLVFFWVISASYTMYYHNKRWTLGLDVIIGAILLGPIMALIVNDGERELKKYERKLEDKEKKSVDRHHRWFRTMSTMSGISDRGFHSILPPPISRVEPPNRKPNNKDFKFFRG